MVRAKHDAVRSVRAGRVAAIATAVAGLLVAGEARADKSAAKVCSELAKQAQRTLWSSVRETGDAMFCRKSWLPGKADELLACGNWTTANLFGSKLKSAWNKWFASSDAGWATWGPRGISVDWEDGSIQAGFKRTFFSAGLATFNSTVEVENKSGLAAATITVCELDHDGKVIRKVRKTLPGNQPNAITSVEIEHQNNSILAVVVDTASVSPIAFRVRALSAPKRSALTSFEGIADVHVHQFMNLGFAGRLYWGQHAGPKSTALAKEEVNISGAGLNLANPAHLVLQLASLKFGIDANMLFGLLATGLSDEGAFQVGGSGAPTWTDWPHHTDRSHQQVHIDWVKEAHERGSSTGSNLKLMVVSLVNNNVLCSLLKVLDKFGNVPARDSKGRITGWTSGPWGCSDHENVTRQLAALHQLERDYPWYRVAMSPWHARQIIADGDLAVVVSMETDKPLSGPDGNYGDWEAQLDAYRALGLVTMQLVHESDSNFAGAAPHRTMMDPLRAVHHAMQAVSNLIEGEPPFELDGDRHNKLGLTAEGNKLVDAMVARNMAIDIAHLSLRARKALFARVPANWGLYDSHTKFARLLAPSLGQTDHGHHVLEREHEFLITESILPEYVKHKVLVGLRTAPVDVYQAPGSNPVANDCPGSANSFAQLVDYATTSKLPIAYGSDFNAGAAMLGPRFGGPDKRCFAALSTVNNRTTRALGQVADPPPTPRMATTVPIDGTNYYTDGLSHIGWLPELTEDLIYLQTPGATQLRRSAEAYLVMWERAFPVDAPSSVSAPTAP